MSWLPILAELGRDDRLNMNGGVSWDYMLTIFMMLGALIVAGVVALHLYRSRERRPYRCHECDYADSEGSCMLVCPSERQP